MCEVNPYCSCDPCECEQPCACGLTQVGHTTDEQWDAGRQELTYTVTSRFRPAPPGQHPAGEDHHAETGSRGERPVGAPEEILDSVSGHASLRANLLEQHEPGSSHSHDSAAGAGHESVRTTTYRGHTIEVHTSYRVLVDGQQLGAHMGVGDDGNVHYHGLPNYTAASALDVMREVVDAFPDDYPSAEPPAGPADGGEL